MSVFSVAAEPCVGSICLKSEIGGTLTILPANLAKYTVSYPSTGVVGDPFSMTVAATDAYGNTRSGASGVTLTVSGTDTKTQDFKFAVPGAK